jgi:hypothetical protein
MTCRLAWMLDPPRLRRNGARRAARVVTSVTVSALVELHQLLIERGFRRSSLDDPTIVKRSKRSKMRSLPTSALISAAPRSSAFRSTRQGFGGWAPRTAAQCSPAGHLPIGGGPESVTTTSADLPPATVPKRKAVV